MTRLSAFKADFLYAISVFTPAWHTINMGTGIISILFHIFPYGNQTGAMQAIALAIHLLNVALFVLITSCAFARYSIFSKTWITMSDHPVQSLYVGAFPMGFSTLISASVLILYEHFGFGGPAFLYALWGLWWLDAAMAFFIFFGQLHVMMSRQQHRLDAMTSVWLLPVVTPIVISSAGGVTALSLQSLKLSYATYTMFVCFWLVMIGVIVSMMILTIYLHRLVVYGLPKGVTVFSVFLPLGPMGQAGYAFLLLGQLCNDILTKQKAQILESEITPQVINIVCLCVSFCLWSLATMWLLLAVGAFLEAIINSKLWFKITFWGTIFPNGVYANLTLQLAIIFDSNFFRVWGAIYSCFTLLIWVTAVLQTILTIWKGDMFRSPALEEQDLIPPIDEKPVILS